MSEPTPTPPEGDIRSQRQAGDYRAELDAYSGPLDLLLYLIKRDEVDVFDIPVGKITEEYLGMVRTMQFLDINVAGDFLLMAATLMETKSRMLLPTQTGEEDSEEAEDDPRDDLVRQLLEYKRFKEAAQELGTRADTHALRAGRTPAAIDVEPAPVDVASLLEGVEIWDLFAAFSALMKHMRFDMTKRIVYNDVPIAVYIDEIRAKLGQSSGLLAFTKFFSPGDERGRIIGIFVALLELTKLGEVRVRQLGTELAEIVVHAVPAEERAQRPAAPAESAAVEAGEADPGKGAAESAGEQDSAGRHGPGLS